MDAGSTPPLPMSVWQHTSGRFYMVLHIANVGARDEVKYPVTVVYCGGNGKVWSRPLHDWHRSMVLSDNTSLPGAPPKKPFVTVRADYLRLAIDALRRMAVNQAGLSQGEDAIGKEETREWEVAALIEVFTNAAHAK